VQIWRRDLYPDTWNPVPTVPVLVDWLQKRLPEACDKLPFIDEFAAAMEEERATLRAVCRETEPKPERLDMPCPSCDLQTLHRTIGDAYPVRCVSPTCRRAFSEDEYEQVLKLYAAAVKRDPHSIDMIAIWRVTDDADHRVTVP
jgi:hypothetical protein